uniref:Uncharacterized protein n=1 Tax=Ditylum brightwellii TaxID=49249 RepID=A0A7S4QUB7_9STRA|mmetsp:Transcript_17559/g.23435  ORF Transcript_17559/g.23435 Transcript_17559/m.23435 type:complete len:114 (-) Transcript_17559:76-417(-)
MIFCVCVYLSIVIMCLLFVLRFLIYFFKFSFHLTSLRSRKGEAAVSAYGLKSLPGSDGEVNVNEDMQEVCNSYKAGDSVPFTATFRAEIDPEKAPPAVEQPAEEQEEEATAEA